MIRTNEVIISSEEMIALNEVLFKPCCEDEIFHTTSYKLRRLQNHNYEKEQKMIQKMELMIKIFISLNDIKRSQVSYLIDTLNIGSENEKIKILKSLGLDHFIKTP